MTFKALHSLYVHCSLNPVPTMIVIMIAKHNNILVVYNGRTVQHSSPLMMIYPETRKLIIAI